MHILMRDIFIHVLQIAILSFPFAVFTAPLGEAQADSFITPQTQQVIKFMRERKDAYLQGDASTWGNHVAEQCTFIQAGGRVLGKAQFIAEMTSFVGYTFSAVLDDVRAAEFGDTIILTYREK